MNVFEKVLHSYRMRRLKARKKDLCNTIRNWIFQEQDVLPEKMQTQLNSLQTEAAALELDSKAAEKLDSLEEKFDSLTQRNSFHMTMRAILDVLLVALTVAFGIRALFLQPFQIPTGSMQPTLFGVHYIDRAESEPYSGSLTRAFRSLLAEDVKSIAPVPFNVWSQDDIYRYTDKNPDQYPPGTVICDGWRSTGDHLFVDRVSIHFYPLKRGEVFIFNTEGLRELANGRKLQGFFYIKRLVGMPGDTLKIVDGVLMVKEKGAADFKPVYELAPRLKKLYSGKGGYHGHIAEGCLMDGREFKVPENQYFALGDNSRNSLDSRFWGAVPRRNIIGRALNIFWPVSRRWGFCIDDKDVLDVPSGTPNPDRPDSQTPAMRLQ